MSEPSTRSPGSIVLRYAVAGIPHVCSARVAPGNLLTDVAGMTTLATTFAEKVAGALPTYANMFDWYTKNALGRQMAAGNFTHDIPGAVQSGGPRWHSFTVTITGLGTGSDGSYSNGKTRLVLFTSSLYAPSEGMMYIGTNSSPGLVDLSLFLASSGALWFDALGGKANVHAKAPVQFNSAIQKRWGC